jgi:hypothetical protein
MSPSTMTFHSDTDYDFANRDIMLIVFFDLVAA